MKKQKNKFVQPRESKKTPKVSRHAQANKNRGGSDSSRLEHADLYGFHAVREAWLNDKRVVKTLYCNANARDGFVATIKEARARGLDRPEPVEASKEQLERSCPQGAVHQGLALVCEALPEIGLEDILIRERDKARSLIVILDQVTDPHNVGAILRSACAFDACALVCQKKYAPELNGVLGKTACGALEHVPVAFETNLSRSIEAMQEAGYFVYGLDERGEDIGALDLAPRAALVLGAEGPGIRRLVKDHCDVLLRLPMNGAMPSINVSNAAAVALYAFSKNL